MSSGGLVLRVVKRQLQLILQNRLLYQNLKLLENEVVGVYTAIYFGI